MNIAELKQHLESYPDDTPCAYSLWLPEDVRSVEKDRGYPVPSADMIADVLDQVYDTHDAEYGISWETIRQCADSRRKTT